LTFIEVGALTTEDEILPGGDSLNHDSRMVPAGNIVVDIGVAPFTSVNVPDNKVVVLGLRVPATVGIELIVTSEESVATTSLRHGGLSSNWLVLLPGFGFNVERVDIAVGNARVVETTVTTVNPEFTTPVASTSVGTRWWGTDSGVLVEGNSFVTVNAGPAVLGDLEPPTVIKTLGW